MADDDQYDIDPAESIVEPPTTAKQFDVARGFDLTPSKKSELAKAAHV